MCTFTSRPVFHDATVAAGGYPLLIGAADTAELDPGTVM